MKINILQWIVTVSGKQKIRIILLTIIQAILGGSGVVYALLLRNGIDYAAIKEKTGFITALISIIFLIMFQIILRAVARWLEENARSSIENAFKSRLFETLLRKNYSDVSSIHSEEWMNRLTSDTKITADGTVDIIPGIIGMTVKMIGAFIMLRAHEKKAIP